MSETRTDVPRIAISETSTRVNRTGSWKYLRPVYRDMVAPCNERCPVGIDIEGYMNLLREDRIGEAIDLLLRENPMPAITGRVCHHPCELACNRRLFDVAVSVHAVERALGDRALHAPIEQPETARPERIAVVGSGPAGLACAWHLARLGYPVTVFDDAIEPGGMLRQGIPEYRLPRAILDAQIERIRRMGVAFRCGLKVGVDVAWTDLRDYDAVFVATGAHSARPLAVPGEDHEAVRPGLDFLKEVNRGLRPAVGSRVVVVGGGNTAIDCARTALRLGAQATILYRRTRDEMPAIAEEVADTEREGVAFVFLAAPASFVADAERLRGVDCMRMQQGAPDASGRRRPVPRPNDRFHLPADLVLTATGEQIDAARLPASFGAKDEIRVGSLGDIVAERSGNGPDGHRGRLLDRVRRTLFFAGGDVAGDDRSVAHALGAGKRAAIGIDQAFSGRMPVEDLHFGENGNASMTRWRRDDPVPRTNPANDVVAFDLLNPSHFTHVGTHDDRHAGVIGDFHEVNLGIPWEAAIEEAKRCFNCGVCNECELCLIFCADVAISRRADGHGFDIDLEYCKGCGVCAEECPRGAITMTREGV
jgi:NADPH-dependent glutamate synthase beta subunit-like oxidoreductase